VSNLTLFKQGNLAIPDYLQQGDEITKLLAGTGGKSISIKGGVWRMIVGGEEVAKNEDRSLNMIVVAAAPKVNRTYYANTFEEGASTPPVCWSADGVRPDQEVPAETRQASTCADCPNNIAGSGEGNSRACRYSRRLAVVLENDISGNVYRLQLPAKSIFGRAEGDKMPLDAYAKFLAGHNVPITGVVTEARFDTAEAVPVVRFRAVRPLERSEWEAACEAGKHPDAASAVEFKMTARPATAALPAPPAPAPAPAPKAAKPPKAAPAPAPVAEPDDDAPAPQVRASKPKETPPPAAAAIPDKVQSVLDSWADDDED
jgi:hypothetical protein